MNKQNENKNRKIKICGIKNSNILKFLVDNSVDYFGLIFYEKSPRYIDIAEASDLIRIAKDTKTKAVGVFVDFSIVGFDLYNHQWKMFLCYLLCKCLDRKKKRLPILKSI